MSGPENTERGNYFIGGSVTDWLHANYPDKNMVIAAVDALTFAPSEVRVQFLEEYTAWLQANSNRPYSFEEADEVAKSNIGYVCGGFERGQQLLTAWQTVTEGVVHPAFGPSITESSDIAFRLGASAIALPSAVQTMMPPPRQ